MMAVQQRVFFFGEGRAEGHGGMKSLLGGKGAGLAEMTNLGLPVPPGFTVSTEVCMAYLTDRRRGLPPGLWEEVLHSMARLESAMNKRFGDGDNPLLVSVRSGAAHSMPGMMDTVLNLGLNDRTVQGLIACTQNERFGYDAYRRFVAMFANVVLGVPRERFEEVLERKKVELSVEQDADLTIKDLKELIERYQALVWSETGREFPSDPYEQLQRSIVAVLDSWMGPRAVEYRRIRQMSDRGGTAVNIVAMVFGNLGETSGTGVVFTRNPSTGVPGLYGDFLLNAQGEDVVAGIRTPQSIEKLASVLPEAYRVLLTIANTLETQYRDMLDLEFTIEDGRLYMLQARVRLATGMPQLKHADDPSFSYRSVYWKKEPFAPRLPIALDPPFQNGRLFAQRGMFTIHGDDERSLEEQCPSCVRKVLLPESARRGALEFLQFASLNELSIFPDMVGVASHIRNLVLSERP